jgi:hypothetical protein
VTSQRASFKNISLETCSFMQFSNFGERINYLFLSSQPPALSDLQACAALDMIITYAFLNITPALSDLQACSALDIRITFAFF